MMTSKPILYLIINNHFDPMWRRCWEKRFTFDGNVFISYADLEEFYLLDNLDLARQFPDYKFEAEFTLVIQKFLERHPERLEELRRLNQQGRFAITGGGQVITDANMILGESLVRNYLLGLLWVEDTFGQKTHLAVRNDAFGNSAQLPQILRGCEISWATGMSYTPAQGLYWRGLDGSTILHASIPIAGQGGGNFKYPPCPACRGAGGNCTLCSGRGISPEMRSALPEAVDPDAFTAMGCARIMLSPEELLPNPELPAWAEKMRAQYDVRFALEEDLLPHVRRWLEQVDQPPAEALHPGVELNPNNTGCLVTRIRAKQTARKLEYALLRAEFLAVQARLQGAGYPQAALQEAWRNLLYCGFHDAITATHVDPAYEELQQYWKKVETSSQAIQQQALTRLLSDNADVISVINSTGGASTQPVKVLLAAGHEPAALRDEAGQAARLIEQRTTAEGQVELTFLAEAVAAHGAKYYHIEQQPGFQPASVSYADVQSPVSIENQRFRIEADKNGLRLVYDKRLRRNILQAASYRPLELILEHDEGSPWATLHPDQSRLPLSGHMHLESIEQGENLARLQIRLDPPFRGGYVSRGVMGRMTVTLVEGLERIDFQASLYWDTFNHRLRVAMPIPAVGRHWYEIPYGMLERHPYQPTFAWAGANGDWAAINWAGLETPDFSLALFNQGIPSYRIEPEADGRTVILLSLLRSPAIPTYLHEPEFYSMTLYDGMRDAGEHDFQFAIAAYLGPLAESPVISEAESYNAGLLALAGRVSLADFPRLTGEGGRIAAVKWAEKGEAVILRVVETRGQDSEVTIDLPSWTGEVSSVNLLERQEMPLDTSGGKCRLKLRPWEIATLRLQFSV